MSAGLKLHVGNQLHWHTRTGGPVALEDRGLLGGVRGPGVNHQLYQADGPLSGGLRAAIGQELRERVGRVRDIDRPQRRVVRAFLPEQVSRTWPIGRIEILGEAYSSDVV